MPTFAISQMSTLALTKVPGKAGEKQLDRNSVSPLKKIFYYKTNYDKIRPGLQPHLWVEVPRMGYVAENREWWALKEQSRLKSPHQSQLLPPFAKG